MPSVARPADPPPARAPAWELPEKYQVLRVIGSGSMGTVLLTRDRNLGRLLAVKVLRNECRQYLERLQSEARILARLEHPSIVRVHELDLFAGRTYMSMEYLAGGNLALTELAPEPLVRVLRGVVDGLGHAHANGIVHRDVKPENVLLVGHGGPARAARVERAVLTDFGLASDSARPAGRTVVGTPLTMSPEQARGEPATPASDVFSLGVTLYRKLSGEWPFRGRTAADVLEVIKCCNPPPMSEAGRPVPKRLEAIVARCLAKNPGERYVSMEELGAALDRWLRPRAFFHLPRTWHPRTWLGRSERSTGPRIHPGELS